MLPQFKPMGLGFTSWNAPMGAMSGSSLSYQNAPPVSSRLPATDTASINPAQDSGGYDTPDEFGPVGPSGPSAPSAPGPSTNNNFGFSFGMPSGADIAGGVTKGVFSAFGAPWASNLAGPAVGNALGNNTGKSLGQTIGGIAGMGLGSLVGLPTIGSALFSYLGGKFGDNSADDGMNPANWGPNGGRGGPSANYNNSFNQAAPPGVGLGAEPGVTTGDLAAPWDNPNGEGWSGSYAEGGGNDAGGGWGGWGGDSSGWGGNDSGASSAY